MVHGTKNTKITEKTSKYPTCQRCQLHIRAKGETEKERIEAHEKGWHHNNKGHVNR